MPNTGDRAAVTALAWVSETVTCGGREVATFAHQRRGRHADGAPDGLVLAVRHPSACLLPHALLLVAVHGCMSDSLSNRKPPHCGNGFQHACTLPLHLLRCTIYHGIHVVVLYAPFMWQRCIVCEHAGGALHGAGGGARGSQQLPRPPEWLSCCTRDACGLSLIHI